VAATLRSQFGTVHAALLATDDRAIAAARARYGLALMCEDVIVNGVLDGQRPLALSTWLARTGMSELPPLLAHGGRAAWTARVRIDVGALRRYARAVYAATDAYLGTQTDVLPTGLGARVLTALLLSQRRLLRDTRCYAIC
jgi:hypothetical protein